jgi:hypothetical protein
LAAGDQKIMFLNSNDSIMDTCFGPSAANSLRIHHGKVTNSNFSSVENSYGITIDAGGSLDERQFGLRSNQGSTLYLNTARKGFVETGNKLIVNGNIESYSSNVNTIFPLLNNGKNSSSWIHNAISLGNALVTNGAANFRFTDMRYNTSNGIYHNSNYMGIGFWGNDDILNVLTNGRVGINTASPKAALEVNGQISVRYDTGWNTGGIRFQDTDGNNDAAIIQGNNGRVYFRAPNGTNGSNGFEWQNGTANVKLMALSDKGDLEIRKNTVFASSDRYAGDPGSYQLIVAPATGNGRLAFAYDGDTNAGYIQSQIMGIGSKPLVLNNAGGEVIIGNSNMGTTNVLTLNGGMTIGKYANIPHYIKSGNWRMDFQTVHEGVTQSAYGIWMAPNAGNGHMWYNHRGSNSMTIYTNLGAPHNNGLFFYGDIYALNERGGAGDITADGTIRANGTILTSDDRIKSDELFIENATETLKKLRPQTYNKWTTMDYQSNSNANFVKESGLIAQEIFYDAPELRHLVNLPEGADSNVLYSNTIQSSQDPSIDPDYKDWGSNIASVNYNGLIPYLIKAIQEKDEQITFMQNNMQTNIEAIETRLQAGGL